MARKDLMRRKSTRVHFGEWLGESFRPKCRRRDDNPDLLIVRVWSKVTCQGCLDRMPKSPLVSMDERAAMVRALQST